MKWSIPYLVPFKDQLHVVHRTYYLYQVIESIVVSNFKCEKDLLTLYRWCCCSSDIIRSWLSVTMDSMSISQSQSSWYSVSNSDRLDEKKKYETGRKKFTASPAQVRSGETVYGHILLGEYLTSRGNYTRPLAGGAPRRSASWVCEVWKESGSTRDL